MLSLRHSRVGRALLSTGKRDALDGFIWGSSTNGSMGLGPLPQKELVPKRIRYNQEDASAARNSLHTISLGPKHSAFVTSSGDLYACGMNDHHQVCESSTRVYLTPVHVPGLPRIVDVGCGSQHTVAVSEDGEVYSWGWGGQWWSFTVGGLGHAGMESESTPKKVEALQGIKIVKVVCGSTHTLALSDSGEMFSWGRGEYGRLGTGTYDCVQPAMLPLKDVVSMDTGQHHGMALDKEGSLYIWGRNNHGQLGLGGGYIDHFAVQDKPMRVTSAGIGDKKVVAIACSDNHSVAATEDGKVFVWGDSKFLVPHDVSPLFNSRRIIDLAAGNHFTLAVDDQGVAYSWGKGTSDCLGHGDRVTQLSPGRIDQFIGSFVLKVTAGKTTAAALCTPIPSSEQ